jgi:cell division protein FtsW
MNMGIIPITGITLPLISSGGSSVISISILFGILFSLRKSSKADKKIDFIS